MMFKDGQNWLISKTYFLQDGHSVCWRLSNNFWFQLLPSQAVWNHVEEDWTLERHIVGTKLFDKRDQYKVSMAIEVTWLTWQYSFFSWNYK